MTVPNQAHSQSTGFVLNSIPHYFPKLLQKSLLQTIFIRIAGKFDQLFAWIFIRNRWCWTTDVHASSLHGNNFICKCVCIGDLSTNLERSFWIISNYLPQNRMHCRIIINEAKVTLIIRDFYNQQCTPVTLAAGIFWSLKCTCLGAMPTSLWSFISAICDSGYSRPGGGIVD